MTSEVKMYKFEPLKSGNWLPWKTHIEAIMTDMKLGKIISGTEKRPIAAEPNTPTDNETKKINDWDERDAKARSVIMLNVLDAEMVHIIGAGTAAEMW